jgi:hypothetical protein
MKFSLSRSVYPLIIGGILLSSCTKDPDDPVIPNEEEVITTLIYTLTPVSGGDTLEFRFTDLDGDGGDAPVISADTLAVNSNYTAHLSLLNEQETPAEDISQEVANEADEHQFFFLTDMNNLTIEYNDSDSNGNPVGLETLVSTTGGETGTLTIILRHEPAKDATGVSEGDITNAGGETDIEVTFNVVLK